MRPIAVVVAAAVVLLGACASAPRTAHVVPFALGEPACPEGDAVEIDEIVGTRPRLEVGGVYLVTGRARVVSHDGARVAIYSTGTGNHVRTRGYQEAVLPRGESEFHLSVAVLADGDLHVTLSPVEDEWSNHPFAGVYFRDPDRPFLFGGVQRIDAAR